MKMSLSSFTQAFFIIFASTIIPAHSQRDGKVLRSLQPFVVQIEPAINGQSELTIPLETMRSLTWPDSDEPSSADSVRLEVSPRRQPEALEVMKGKIKFQSSYTIRSVTYMGGPAEASFSLCSFFVGDDGETASAGFEQNVEVSAQDVTGIECAAFFVDLNFFNGVASWRDEY